MTPSRRVVPLQSWNLLLVVYPVSRYGRLEFLSSQGDVFGGMTPQISSGCYEDLQHALKSFFSSSILLQYTRAFPCRIRIGMTLADPFLVAIHVYHVSYDVSKWAGMSLSDTWKFLSATSQGYSDHSYLSCSYCRKVG